MCGSLIPPKEVLSLSTSLVLSLLERPKKSNDLFFCLVFDFLLIHNNDPENDRFKTLGGPVDIFDNNARVSFKPTLNPLELHSYNNYGNIGKTQMIKK